MLKKIVCEFPAIDISSERFALKNKSNLNWLYELKMSIDVERKKVQASKNI